MRLSAPVASLPLPRNPHFVKQIARPGLMSRKVKCARELRDTVVALEHPVDRGGGCDEAIGAEGRQRDQYE